MKQVNSRNQIWFERNDNVVTVGFTREFLDTMDQCWHILPAHLNKFRENSPLMIVETNDNLISIKSPVTAFFGVWSPKAQNFPYKLTEEDVVLEMSMVQAARPVAAGNHIADAIARTTATTRAAARNPAMDWGNAAERTVRTFAVPTVGGHGFDAVPMPNPAADQAEQQIRMEEARMRVQAELQRRAGLRR